MAILTMPFLRRRGNPALESDTRQQADSARSDKDADKSAAATSPDGDAAELDEYATATAQTPRDSTTSRPDTSHNQDDASRQKRFSVMRFRNASDSQLSLKAKQQAEQLPPLPSSTCRSVSTDARRMR